MNHTVNKIIENKRLTEISKSSLSDYLVVAMMIIYSVLAFGLVQNDASTVNLPAMMLLNILLYFVAIYLYYGIARLAYNNRNYLLWGFGFAAFVISYLFGGLSSFWPVFTGTSMLLFSGAIVGRLTRQKKPQMKVYILGMLPVVIFTISMFAPIWNELMLVAGEYFETVVESVQNDAVSLGYGSDAVAKSLDSTKKMVAAFIRILPAVMVVSAVMQFSVGYMIFLYLLMRKNPTEKLIEPFTMWKVPFAIMPAVVLVLALRVFGSDMITQIADNIIAFLVIFYAVAGFGLIEFYLRKFKFSLFFKILFYIMIFLTQLIGFLASALLGFVDSFTDWRKVQKLKFEEK